MVSYKFPYFFIADIFELFLQPDKYLTWLHKHKPWSKNTPICLFCLTLTHLVQVSTDSWQVGFYSLTLGFALLFNMSDSVFQVVSFFRVSWVISNEANLACKLPNQVIFLLPPVTGAANQINLDRVNIWRSVTKGSTWLFDFDLFGYGFIRYIYR